MGFYYCTVLCVGFYKKNDVGKLELPKNIKTFVDDRGTLYYIEYTFLKHGSIDRLVDENDLNRGHILLSEAKQILKFNNVVEDCDMINLKKLEEQLKPEHIIDSYLIEYSVCTMDIPPSSSSSLIMSII